jgi:uncharacterized Tic20 family protein
MDPVLPVPTDEEKMFALLAHLSGCASWFLGPLIIYMIKKDQSKFVAYHGMQALIFHSIAGFLVYAVITVTCGIGFPLIVVPWIVAAWIAFKAYNGEWVGYPMLDKYGRDAITG